MSTPRSQLDALRRHTVVVADTSDFAQLARYGARDATTNPTLVLKAATQPQYAELLDAALRDTPRGGLDEEAWLAAVVEAVLVAFGRAILAVVPGRVSTETPAHLSFDIEALVTSGRRLVRRYEALGVPRERVLIKVAATWEGIQAARQLEAEGIHCNLTLLFSLTQAVACAEAGVTLISPFVGRILDWYRAHAPEALEPDPGVQSVERIWQYFKLHGHATEVMGASFRSTAQVLALSGCDLLTISPALLDELATTVGEVERRLDTDRLPDPPPALPMSEAMFRWAMNEDRMASEKLAEGLRLFHGDGERLAELLRARALA